MKEDLAQGGWEHWPVTYEDLEPHYERHEAMLEAAPYPRGGASLRHPKDDCPPRRRARARARVVPAQACRHLRTRRQATARRTDPREHENLHGRTRQTCRLCGECNWLVFGSKYTLDFNYLSFAKLRHGLDRTRCEAKTLAPRPGGGRGRLRRSSQAVEGEERQAPLPELTVTADRLVLSAGVFGLPTSKNRANFPGLGDRLGTRFCGNGDLLTFAMQAHETVDGQRRGRLIEPAGRSSRARSASRISSKAALGARSTSRTAAIRRPSTG